MRSASVERAGTKRTLDSRAVLVDRGRETADVVQAVGLRRRACAHESAVESQQPWLPARCRRRETGAHFAVQDGRVLLNPAVAADANHDAIRANQRSTDGDPALRQALLGLEDGMADVGEVALRGVLRRRRLDRVGRGEHCVELCIERFLSWRSGGSGEHGTWGIERCRAQRSEGEGQQAGESGPGDGGRGFGQRRETLAG